MLENIKLVLGITDASKDNLINYYINVYQRKIIAYCNLIEFPLELESTVEELIINKMSNKDSTVKSESIGDYRIDYNVSSDELTSYSKILNKFRKAKFI
jgi:hypothetical protein